MEARRRIFALVAGCVAISVMGLAAPAVARVDCEPDWVALSDLETDLGHSTFVRLAFSLLRLGLDEEALGDPKTRARLGQDRVARRVLRATAARLAGTSDCAQRQVRLSWPRLEPYLLAGFEIWPDDVPRPGETASVHLCSGCRVFRESRDPLAAAIGYSTLGHVLDAHEDVRARMKRHADEATRDVVHPVDAAELRDINRRFHAALAADETYVAALRDAVASEAPWFGVTVTAPSPRPRRR